MKQIAKVAEVSPATVSYVLNRTEGESIPLKTRCRVLAAAKKLKYQTSVLQRAIKSPLCHIGIGNESGRRMRYRKDFNVWMTIELAVFDDAEGLCCSKN